MSGGFYAASAQAATWLAGRPVDQVRPLGCTDDCSIGLQMLGLPVRIVEDWRVCTYGCQATSVGESLEECFFFRFFLFFHPSIPSIHPFPLPLSTLSTHPTTHPPSNTHSQSSPTAATACAARKPPSPACTPTQTARAAGAGPTPSARCGRLLIKGLCGGRTWTRSTARS
jgi:hypothetical protein